MPLVNNVNTQKIDVAKRSHIVLDNEYWHINFTGYMKRSNDELLFFVSLSRQLGRWLGYISSLGISAVFGGNRLSEMSIKVEGEDSNGILQEFVDEYQRSPDGISPAMIKSTIKHNYWYVMEYSYTEMLYVRLTGFRVQITIRKTP